MNLAFRTIRSPEALTKLIDFLKEDVKTNGGSASEVIDMWDNLYEISVSQSPWGLIVIKKPTTAFEAWAAWITTDV